MPILLPSIAQDTMTESSIAVIPSGDAPPATCKKGGRASFIVVFAVRNTDRPANQGSDTVEGWPASWWDRDGAPAEKKTEQGWRKVP